MYTFQRNASPFLSQLKQNSFGKHGADEGHRKSPDSGPLGRWNEAKLGGIKTEVLSEDHKKTPTSSSGIETW